MSAKIPSTIISHWYQQFPGMKQSGQLNTSLCTRFSRRAFAISMMVSAIVDGGHHLPQLHRACADGLAEPLRCDLQENE